MSITPKYIIDSSKFDELNDSDIDELVKMAKKGDKGAVETIFSYLSKLVVDIVLRHSHNEELHEDLLNEGFLSIYKAIDNYDLDKGAKFSTYSVWWIKMSVSRYEGRVKHAVRVPEWTQGDVKVSMCLLEEHKLAHHSFADNVIKSIDSNIIKSAMSRAKLTKRERECAELYFGHCEDADMNHKEIGDALGISRSNVSKNIMRAVKKISKLVCR